jgi:hypothetical protein
MSKVSKRPSAAPVQTVHDDAFERTLARMRAMTNGERVQSLKNAGILTAKGNYTKPYRILAGQSGR